MAYRILKSNELQIIRSHGTADAMRLTGLTRRQVRNARHYHQAPSPSPSKAGRLPKLCGDDIAQMMMLRVSGFSLGEIAKLKDISKWGVQYALKNAEQYGFNKYPPRGRV